MPRNDSDSSAAVSCRGLRKSFDGTHALAGVDLDVPAGTITALLGPSGCGKTTALRVIAGFERPDEGEVTLDGETVATADGAVSPERRRIGMVFQDYALFPHLSVAQNIAYGLRGRRRLDRRRLTTAAIELVGLTGFEDRMPAELSGGEQQRVALARALAPSPRVILLDEPFSNLDATLRVALRNDVRRILETAGTTAIFVTHDQEEALSLADRVAVMSAGSIHQVADPHSIYTRPADRFVASFVGDADLLPGVRVTCDVIATALGEVLTTTPIDREHVDVVLRPECIALEPDPSSPVVVEEVSYFGHDQLVHVRLADGTRLRSRLGPDPHLRPGDRVTARVATPIVTLPSATVREPRPGLVASR